MGAATDVKVQLGSGGLVVEAATEVEVWLGSGGLAVETAAEVEVEVQLGTRRKDERSAMGESVSCLFTLFWAPTKY